MPEYRCENCGHEASGSPFRAACPVCGGQLRRVDRGTAPEIDGEKRGGS